MKREKITLIIAAIFFLVGFLILLDQYIKIGEWFQIKDLHHETFAISAIVLAIGIIIGATISNKFSPST